MPKENVVHAHKDLAEGLDVRSTARVNHVDKITIEMGEKNRSALLTSIGILDARAGVDESTDG